MNLYNKERCLSVCPAPISPELNPLNDFDETFHTKCRLTKDDALS